MAWYGSSLGLASPTYLKALEASGVEPAEYDFSTENVGRLVRFIVNGSKDKTDSELFWALSSQENLPLSRHLPFSFSMLHLSRYRSIKYRDWQEPVIAIAGNTLDDFCLYFALSRLRDRVVWILPSITDKVLRGTCKQEYVSFEFQFVSALHFLARGDNQHEPGLSLVSASLPDEQLESYEACFSLLLGDAFETKPKISKNIRALVQHPFTIYETANIDREQTKVVVGETLPGFFDTPKPRRLRQINPNQHRWIVDLRFHKYHLPKHPALAEHIMKSPGSSSKDLRMSSMGPAYFALSILIPAGEDIDRVLARPELRRPSPVSLAEILARAGGFSRALISDKGFYSLETLTKFGGLQALAAFLLDPKKRPLLKKFLDDSENKAGVFDEGARLNLDRRRYLNFPAVEKIVGDSGSSARVIDDLIEKAVLFRGLILKCRFCRNADWFPLSQSGEKFSCRRCGRRQHMTRDNWFAADGESNEASFYYKLDEIVYQGLKNDMDIPLLALAAIERRCKESFLFAPEMWFFKGDESKPWIEADILCVADGIFRLGEVKSGDYIAPTGIQEKPALSNYCELASALGAREMVLATGSAAWSSGTLKNINEILGRSDLRIIKLAAADLFRAE